MKMKTKKYKQGLVTSLTALSTAMLCHTATTYASDIEIYKAPTTGGATLMLALDFSTSMTGSSPIKKDFFNNTNGCTDETNAVSTRWNGTSHSFTGTYCWIKETQKPRVENLVVSEYKVVERRDGKDKDGDWYVVSSTKMATAETTSSSNLTAGTATTTYSSLAEIWRNKILASCIQSDINTVSDGSPTESWNKKGSYFEESDVGSGGSRVRKRSQLYTVTTKTVRTTETGTKYSCPDRVTMLKKSLYDLIAGNSTVNGITTTITPLVATASIGFTTFPSPTVRQTPLLLNTANRTTLLTAITSYSNSSGTPIANAYATSAKGVTDYIASNSSTAACAGYGVYFLTDGAPYSDNRGTARTTINTVLSSDAQITSTQCSGTGSGSDSWKCVEPIAKALQEKKNIRNTEIKTAIVGFGSEFSFNDSSGVAVPFSANYTADQAENLFTGSNQKAAARAATLGKGGWFSANNTNDIVSSVTNFVNSIRVEIPAITTGTSAIPQDVLNTSVIQPYAYFPQFQPKPSEEFRAWTGNLKKYNVSGGLLKDKSNTALFSSAGVLNTANEDLWTPNYTASITAAQQSLKSLGGLLSRLNLKKTDSNLNRKVFTSNGITSITVDEAYIKGAPATRGYYLGLLGYNVTQDQVAALSNDASVDALLTSATELRQIGAVMHSTPVLLTQSGKIVNSATGNDTTNRDDYVLFGTTQGVLHVVKAGKSDEITTVGNTAGQEIFAFVPQEMLAAQGKAFLDPPQTVVEGGTSNGMNNLYYGVDGAWTAHTEYVYNNADETFKVYDTSSKYGKQWIYGGLRMGGRSYYALDLTKMAETTGNEPVVKFRINPVTSSVDGFPTPSGETTRYANLGKMGQSWSKPTIANVQWKGKRRLVMFVGGGYDAGYETFNYNQDNGVGAGVYMFDANTGELLWSSYDAVKTPAVAGKTLIGDGDYLKYSVVSQIKGVDRDGDGDVDHLYFGDLGGQVFRVDLDSKHTASDTYANYAKQITRIYNGHVANGYSPRFYEMPAFTVYSDTGGLFAVISIGSGNRSTPLLGKVVNATTTNSGFITPNETATTNDLLRKDAIYNIYDKGVIASTPPEPETSPTIDALHQLTDTNRISAATLATWREVATVVGTGSSAVNYSAKSGWYYPFTSSVDVGGRKAVEKVQGDLIAIDNDLYVSTFDAEAVGTTESCGAGIYGASRAHRFCMPYGQCANGDTVANNTLNLGKGLLGITMGPGTTGADRRIVTPLGPTAGGNRITDIIYGAANKLISQSWYEKN